MARNNMVELVGYIGRDAQINGNVARTSIAVRNAWKDSEGQWHERTHWIPLVGFGTQSIVRGLSKGAHVKVSGRLQSSQFTDREGQPHVSIEVVVLNVEPIARREAEAEPVADVPIEEPAPQPKPRRRRKAAPPVDIATDEPTF
jgi:single stranded DNA-binding protein